MIFPAKGADGDNSEKLLVLEQQLVEQEQELAALRKRLAFTELQNLNMPQEEISDSQNTENIPSITDSSEALPGLENTSEGDTTLIAVDTETSAMSACVMSSSADNESSSEMTGPHPESPVEVKGASSDEMVTSTDSEVVQSSWTLLEAINQDAGQEWPQHIQDLNALHLSTQSWEETSEEQVTSTCSMVKVESSSLVIQETVQIQISQQEANLLNADSSPSQALAQILAEELQKRYSELLSELQQMKDLAAESQDKVHLLEEEQKSLTVVKNEAEERALRYKRDLMEARTQIQREVEQNALGKNTLSVHEEQLESLQKEAYSKNQMIQSLQADLDEIQQKFIEKEGQARMLGAQLEERELVSSELEEKVVVMETRVQQFSEEAERAKATLLDKTSELNDLQQSLSLKEQEMMELGNSMTAKLLQAGEDNAAISSEAKMLKEQMMELEKTWDHQQKVRADKTADESETFVALRNENENLITEIATMKADGEQVKRKLQAALVQRKELMKKIADFKKDSEEKINKEKVHLEEDVTSEQGEQQVQKLEAQLQETRQLLTSKEKALNVLEQKMLNQDQALADAHVKIQQLIDEAKALGVNEQIMRQFQEDNSRFQSQVSNLETELDVLQKKLQEAVDSRKDTLRKAKEKDRHHREQLRHQKEEYSGLLERFEAKDDEKLTLIRRVQELESLLVAREPVDKEKLVNVEKVSDTTSEKPGLGDWVQEDWVDFTSSDTENSKQGSPAEQPPQTTSENHESVINNLQDKVKAEQTARVDLETQLRESLSLKETELFELSKELETLRSKEKQINVLSEELDSLRKKCEQAEAHAEMLKAEVEEAAVVVKTSISDAESPVVALQAEVDEFKQFLKSKNDEIIDLSQQLSEQTFLLQKLQETVLEKDQLIVSLQEGLKAEQQRSQKLEAEIPQKQEEEQKDNSAKLQQLQRKLQAALVSRKEALKENHTLKEELTSAEKVRSDLLAKITNIEANLSSLSTEKDKLIEEVDRTLLENQSLDATCESLKLAMDGLLNEKETYKRQFDDAREEAKQATRWWEEKVHGMKEEYETLLKSYENVSDEAERVRKVLEASRQERQESAAKARAYETAKQESEKLAEEAQKEVNAVKDKMRKFAKTKHQKIMELEEENEKLREQVEKKGTREPDTNLKQDLKKVKDDFEDLKAKFDSLKAERNVLEHETEELKNQLAQEMDKKNSLDVSSSGEFKEHIVTQHLSPVLTENQEDLAFGSFSRQSKLSEQEIETKIERTESQHVKTDKQLKEKEAALEVAEGKLKELQAALENEKSARVEQESLLNAELFSLRQNLQESVEREEKLKEECSKRETKLQVTQTRLEDTMETRVDQEPLLSAEVSSLKQHLRESAEREQRLNVECSKKENQLQELRKSLEVEKDDLEERLMNQLAQVNGSIAGYQQEAADSRDRLVDLQRKLEKVQREQAEVEALLAGERDRAARLEEDKRQAERERAEAEAGKQRQLEQKLKSAQRVKEGSQSRARQLEELLREKQLEVRQMQKDCIQYQERISVLDRETKTLLLGRDEVSKELEAAHQEMTKIKEERSRLESELLTYKAKLNMAQGELSQALAEKVACEQLLHRREAELKTEAERTLDEVRYRLGAELKQMELRLEQAYRDREREEEATLVAKNIAVAAEKYAQETQARLDESLARLAAFSRSMSSLQDDRDRVLDEAKQWESRFHSALQGKETELREAESRAKDLFEQLQKKTTQKEQLQSSLERFVLFRS